MRRQTLTRTKVTPELVRLCKTRESASAGDAVKPVLCPRGGCRFGDGRSVCGDYEDALS